MLSGQDITFITSDTNPTELIFGTHHKIISDETGLGGGGGLAETLYLQPQADFGKYLYLGTNSLRWEQIVGLASSVSLNSQDGDDTDHVANLFLGAKTFLNTEALLQIETGATGGTFSSVLLKHAGGAGAADHSLAIKLENTVIATFTPTGFGHGIAVPQTNVHIQESNTSTLPAVEIEQLSTGDAALQFSVVGDCYAIGIDNSDFDLFKISYSSTAGGAVLGTNDRLSIFSDGGVTIGAPAGGSKGAGTLNAQAVYDSGVLLTDFVFKPGYEYLSIPEMRAFFQKEHRLPTIDGEAKWEKEGMPPLGILQNQLWETVEVQAIYIAELEQRLSQVEELLPN